MAVMATVRANGAGCGRHAGGSPSPPLPPCQAGPHPGDSCVSSLALLLLMPRRAFGAAPCFLRGPETGPLLLFPGTPASLPLLAKCLLPRSTLALLGSRLPRCFPPVRQRHGVHVCWRALLPRPPGAGWGKHKCYTPPLSTELVLRIKSQHHNCMPCQSLAGTCMFACM